MELAEIIGLRPIAGAGLLASITRRCPLACAHCSTASTLRGEHLDSAALLRFVATFTPRDRPEVIVITGGEPMLRPRLVTDVAELARASGTRSAVLTGAFFARGGAFFARGGRFPAAVRRAVDAVDHCSVSLDAYHESQVPRQDVFDLLRGLMDRGVAVSLHVVGTGAADPYLEDVTSDVVKAFGGCVPMLVSELQPLGRAVGWRTAVAAAAATAAAGGTAVAAGGRTAVAAAAARAGPVEPCALAAWPVIAFDGTITACCNQDVVDGPGRSAHLRLGHIATGSWSEIRRRSMASPALRVLRAVGPRHLGHTAPSAGPMGPAEYCATGQAFDEDSAGQAGLLAFAAGAAGELLDREAGRIQARRGPAGFLRRYGCARHADLVTLHADLVTLTGERAV